MDVCDDEGEEGDALAGKARLIAGPNPFQRALTPSCLIVLDTQSMKPE